MHFPLLPQSVARPTVASFRKVNPRAAVPWLSKAPGTKTVMANG